MSVDWREHELFVRNWIRTHMSAALAADTPYWVIRKLAYSERTAYDVALAYRWFSSVWGMSLNAFGVLVRKSESPIYRNEWNEDKIRFMLKKWKRY